MATKQSVASSAPVDDAEFLFAKLARLEAEVERLSALEEEVEQLKRAVGGLGSDNNALEDMLEALQRRVCGSGERKIGGLS